MKKVLIAIARALAAVPRYALVWCARAGDFVLSMIPGTGAGPVTTAAGEEADDALMEIRQAREEARMMKPTKAHLTLTWAAAVVSGTTPPDVSREGDAFQMWLADLEPCACRALLRCSMGQVEAHLDAKRTGDHIAGVPSYGDRPDAAAPVGRGSKRGNEASVVFVDRMFAELLSEPEPQRA